MPIGQQLLGMLGGGVVGAATPGPPSFWNSAANAMQYGQERDMMRQQTLRQMEQDRRAQEKEQREQALREAQEERYRRQAESTESYQRAQIGNMTWEQNKEPEKSTKWKEYEDLYQMYIDTGQANDLASAKVMASKVVWPKTVEGGAQGGTVPSGVLADRAQGAKSYSPTKTVQPGPGVRETSTGASIGGTNIPLPYRMGGEWPNPTDEGYEVLTAPTTEGGMQTYPRLQVPMARQPQNDPNLPTNATQLAVRAAQGVPWAKTALDMMGTEQGGSSATDRSAAREAVVGEKAKEYLTRAWKGDGGVQQMVRARDRALADGEIAVAEYIGKLLSAGTVADSRLKGGVTGTSFFGGEEPEAPTSGDSEVITTPDGKRWRQVGDSYVEVQ